MKLYITGLPSARPLLTASLDSFQSKDVRMETILNLLKPKSLYIFCSSLM